MNSNRLTIGFLVAICVCCAGCVSTPATVQPSGFPTTARDQIGHLAVRGPTRPAISLHSELNGKGKAAGRTAASASAGWLGAVFEGAGSSNDEGAIFVAALGIMVTPLVAAGGAAYGAAAADSPEAVEKGNAILRQTLDFTPKQLEQALMTRFEETSPVRFEFVPAEATNAELAAKGFDSVLDVEMGRIASFPSRNQMHVFFRTYNSVRLTDLDDGRLLGSKDYTLSLPEHAVSSWAGNDGAKLSAELSNSFAEMADDLTRKLFVVPAIRVRGIEPRSKNQFQTARIPGKRPMFVWSALDGSKGQPPESIEYEFALVGRGDKTPTTYRTRSMRFVPPKNLDECRVYNWRVRAHYLSYGSETTSEWTPDYRFKTECE